jgi:Flp pilus assembly protein TadD
MNSRLLAFVGAAVLLLGAVVLVFGRPDAPAWRSRHTTPPAEVTSPAPPADAPAESSQASNLPVGNLPAGDLPVGDPPAGDLPVPPFPPRIAEGEQYDKCLTMIADDPQGAEAIATSWQTTGGGEGAIHCQALASIAAGKPEIGAKMLEDLARGGKVQGSGRAVLFVQAAEARLMIDQAEPALQDATDALAIRPDDPDLLISHANANDTLDRQSEAIEDLTRALQLDPSRSDALVLRASLRRRMDQLEEARADISRALALDPEDAEALLERGIQRQETGDLTGARQDWTHAQTADPNSEAAELAAQNLALLDAGPTQK